MSTIFEKIIKRELPAEVLFENEHIIAIQDIHPVAPVHILIITKKPLSSLQELTEEDSYLMKEVVLAAQKLAVEMGVEEGYRLLTNIGRTAGQSVFHLHFHLIGGRQLGALA